jgi:hypothetical protein
MTRASDDGGRARVGDARGKDVWIEWRFNWFRNQSPGSRARSKIGRNYRKRIRPNRFEPDRRAILRARSAKAWCGWHGTKVGRRRLCSAPRQLVSKPVAGLPSATKCAKALAPAGGAQESRIDAPLVSKPVRGMFAEMESGTRLETANESGRLWRAHSFTAEGEPGQDVNNQGQDGQRT